MHWEEPEGREGDMQLENFILFFKVFMLTTVFVLVVFFVFSST